MILSVLNNKGGTGKTTTSVNVAAALAMRGMKVLLVDLDPQGSATTSFGVEKAKLPSTIYNVLTQNKPLAEVLLPTPVENLTLVPSNLDFTEQKSNYSPHQAENTYFATCSNQF